MKNKHIYIFLFFFILIAGCSSGVRFTDKPREKIIFEQPIKVLIDSGKDLISHTCSSPKILLVDNKRAAFLKKGDKIFVTAVNKKVTTKVGNKILTGNTIDLIPDDSRNLVIYQKKKYRGLLRFVSLQRGLSVLNILPMEEYLKGVVPMEMGVAATEKRYEALKAFTISARNYAVMKMKNQAEFDVYTDVRDQVYGGADSERVITNRAVNETKSLILKYGQENAIMFYHAACGGMTEDVGNVFQRQNIPYLKEIKDGNNPNCTLSQTFYWSETYSGEDIIRYLIAADYLDNHNYNLEDFRIVNRLPSGRVNELLISLIDIKKQKEEIRIYKNNIRYIIKRNDSNSLLRSTMFDVSLKRNNSVLQITINGKGNGHGVGMCQWGAIGLAEQGKNYKYILDFYFRGTTIGKL